MSMRTKYATNPQSGFTLIEVLASMAVLVVLVLALTRMFAEATSISRRGTTALMRNSMGSTAMETLMQDAEGMAVNERLACCFRANTTDNAPDGFGFDEAWFVTTSGDQDDSRAYQMVHYYVTNSLTTNALGAPYMRFQLMREVGIFANADNWGCDIMSKGMDWWNPANWDVDTYNNRRYVHYSDKNLLAENVVRFDFYLLGWSNRNAVLDSWLEADGPPTNIVFNSIIGPVIDRTQSNLPPAAIDVYMQITSPDAAAESGMALVPDLEGDLATREKARDMMIRESATLLGRVSPVSGGGQKLHPALYYTD